MSDGNAASGEAAMHVCLVSVEHRDTGERTRTVGGGAPPTGHAGAVTPASVAAGPASGAVAAAGEPPAPAAAMVVAAAASVMGVSRSADPGCDGGAAATGAGAVAAAAVPLGSPSCWVT
jgi:hypothetical protein